MVSSRYNRQEDLVNLEEFHNKSITIVGVGAIGREVALKLTQMGFENIILVDFDSVEETNICTQGYTEAAIGAYKTLSTQKACLAINSKANITPVTRRFSRKTEVTPIVFCCVDKMSARKLIFETVKDKAELFIDTRMSAESLKVLTAYSPAGYSKYEKTLFSDEEAYQGRCTAKSTCYCASIAAGLAVSQLAKYSRHLENLIEEHINFNIFAMELSFGE